MMPIRFFLLCLSGISLCAQNNPPPEAPEVYLNHAGHRRSALSADQALAPGSLAEVSVFLNNPPSQASLEKVFFKAPGVSEFVELTQLSPLRSSQATVRIPIDSPSGEAQLLIQLTGGSEKRLSFPVQDSNFGWFTRFNDPNGAAIAQASRISRFAAQPLLLEVKLTQPASPGDVLTLWGTGLGRAKPESIRVEIGGKLAIATYAGPAPGYPGLDQINVALPEGVANDCYIPLRLYVGDKSSPPASVAIAEIMNPATAPACRHRLGLQPDQLAMLDKGESIRMGQTWAYGTLMPDFEKPVMYRRFDAATIDFLDRSAAFVQTLTGLFEPPRNGCRLEAGATGAAFVLVRPFDYGQSELLGPNGFRESMEGLVLKNYTFPTGGPYPLQSDPGFSMSTGVWKISVSGGPELKPLETPLRLPPALRWLNRDAAMSHSLKDDLLLSWAADGYGEGERMSATLQLQPPAQGMAILCEAPASAGSIILSSTLLQTVANSLPAAANITLRLSPNTSSPRLSQAFSPDGKVIPLISTFVYSEMIQSTLH